jgi:hypothetical protein
MNSGTLTVFLVSLGVGIPVFVGGLLWFIFSLVRRATAAARAALEAEGVVLDTGPQWVTIRYANFRAPGFYRGVGISKTRGALVLTRRRFVFTPSRRQFFLVERSDLGRFTVGIAEDGALHVHSDDPPHATGSIGYRVMVSDAAAWVKALTEAGARPRGR